jgi:hypothetical protein
MLLMRGRHLGPNEIVALLGVDGMGEVYRARDSRLGRDVAIKVLPPQFSVDLDRVRRFEQEARAASLLNHPHILTIHEIGREDDVLYRVTSWYKARREHFADDPAVYRVRIRDRKVERVASLTEIRQVWGGRQGPGWDWRR